MTVTVSATGVDLLAELEPVVEQNLNRHLGTAKEWFPHEYVPWSAGRDFDTEPWEPEQSRLSADAQAALEINLLTEDNLPSYHHIIAERYGLDGPWGTWVHRWTAEEGRHGQALRDYLLVTRGVDPIGLERARMATVEIGYPGRGDDALSAIIYVTLQELATRVAHRNAGRASGDPVAERLLSRIAVDENLHMVFYRSLMEAALQVAPSETVTAFERVLRNFAMPGRGIPGFTRRALAIARAGIYNLRVHHDEVAAPLVRYVKVLDLGGLDASGAAAQERLGVFVAELDRAATRQTEQIEAAQAKRLAAAPITRRTP
jgi:acyl-[acyl-carrier protein] desaturase